MAEFRFTPYSIEAFKRIARDITKAYPLTLQQSQEALAKTYGYPDLHALQEHMKTGPEPGARGAGADFAAVKVDGAFLEVAHDLYGTDALRQKGRMAIYDLCLTWDPARRKQAMDFEEEIDRVIDGDFAAELDVQTAEYVTFEDRMYEEPLNRPAHEGMFVVTTKGDTTRRAINWLKEGLEIAAERNEPEEHDRLFQKLTRLLALMPNNPFVAAAWLDFARFGIQDEKGQIPGKGGRTAEYSREVKPIWSLAKECRAMFDGLMPKNFRGKIAPNLAGIGIENEPYFDALFVGALSALALGRDRTALAWARRAVALDPTDRVGARQIFEMLDAEQPPYRST